MFNIKTNNMKENEITKDLLISPSLRDKDIKPNIGTKYLNVIMKNNLILETIFLCRVYILQKFYQI
jgi:hypothetical protein